jgi:predicted branched-subunit amino acid permease
MLQLIPFSNPHFRRGAFELLPACVGIFTWGLMTGVAMINSGMDYSQSLLMTFCVFAGSSQLAALPLLASHAPIWVILATSFCVNLRFVVFSAHLRNYLISHPRWRRVLFGYFTADISYVQFIKHFPTPSDSTDHLALTEQAFFLSGSNAMNWSSWMSGSLLGIFLTQFIPTHWGLGFAGILALLGISLSLVSSQLRLLSGALAAVTAIYFIDLPFNLNVLLGILVSIAICDQLSFQLTKNQSLQNQSTEGER